MIRTTGLGFLIGDFFLPYYGLMIFLGLTVACALGYKLIKRHGKDVSGFVILAITGVMGGFLGAKLLYLIINWGNINFNNLSDVMQGGFVFYGGILGALAVILVLKLTTKIDVPSYVQIAIACVPIAHGFGRIGCHLVGCCYGKEYDGFGAIVYQDSFLTYLNGKSVFPVQLTEAICLFALGIGLIIYVWRHAKPQHTLGIYLVSYAVLRFVLEYLRGDEKERKIYGCFSTSQWMSICVVAGVLGFYIYKMCKKK